PSLLTTTVPHPCGSCSAETYTVAGGSVQGNSRTSPTTPTICIHGACCDPSRMRRPRGLVPGQNCRAMPSLMTATGGVSLRSSAPNPRPRRNGIERREVAGRHGYTARHVGATCDVGATLGDERVGSACCVSQPRRDDHRGRG